MLYYLIIALSVAIFLTALFFVVSILRQEFGKKLADKERFMNDGEHSDGGLSDDKHSDGGLSDGKHPDGDEINFN